MAWRTRKECNEYRKRKQEAIPKSEKVKALRERQRLQKVELFEFLERLEGKTAEEIEEAKRQRRNGKIAERGEKYERQLQAMERAREVRSLKCEDRKEVFLAVLKATGNESKARAEAGIYYLTFSDWLKLESFRVRYEDVKRHVVDKAVEVIVNSLNENDVETAKFVLKHNRLAGTDWGTTQTLEIKQEKSPSWCEDEEALLIQQNLKQLVDSKTEQLDK